MVLEVKYLEDIANTIHLNKSECCHLFKRNVKCTIFEYIQDYRINKRNGQSRPGLPIFRMGKNREANFP